MAPHHSSPERALLELLDELPHSESFHQVDMLVKGLRDLSPARCKSPDRSHDGIADR